MASKYDGATIEILNWAKYNPRKDLKATSWFRLQNNLFEDPNFFDFTDAEFRALIYILSVCSKKQSGTWRISGAHVDRIGRIKEKDFSSAVDKLSELQVVRITFEARNVDVTPTSRERDTDVTLRNEQTDETDVTDRRADFDFQALYKKYPRKVKPTDALERMKRLIRTPADYEALSQALDRFIDYHKRKGTEAGFIPHMTTFLGVEDRQCWRDWLDPETGTETGFQGQQGLDWSGVKLEGFES